MLKKQHSRLGAAFFARPTLAVARDLLGAVLVHDDPEAGRLAGRVVETEAYLADDPALHGWKAAFGPDGRVLPEGRAAGLFGPPGTAYVYKIYYTNWLLNVVTEPEGVAGAVLIRALEPVEGEAAMAARRPASVRRRRDLANGPGKLTQALGIAESPEATRSRFHGADLTAPPLCFEAGAPVPEAAVATSSRIGLSRGVDWPYRFFVADNPFVSPGVPSDVRLAQTAREG
ncbi:MAG: DNA-3-methyladenine glycosylase [Bacteroidota bacterium]